MDITANDSSKSPAQKIFETVDFLTSKWVFVAYHIALVLLGVVVATTRFNANFWPGLGVSACLTIVCLTISCFITKPFHRLLDIFISDVAGGKYSDYYTGWIKKEEDRVRYSSKESRDWTRWEVPMVFTIPTLVFLYFCLNLCSGFGGQCWIINDNALSIGSSKVVLPFGNKVELVNDDQTVRIYVTGRSATGEDVRAAVVARLTLSKETDRWSENSAMKNLITEDLDRKFGIIIQSMSLAELQNNLIVEKKLTDFHPPYGTRWSGPVSVTDMHIVPRSK